MHVVNTSVRVWMNTIIFNSLFFSIMGVVYGEIVWLLSVPFMCIGGIIVGLPFLVMTILLIKAASLLPYTATARICWVAVMEAIFVGLFYMSINYVVHNSFSWSSSLTQILTGTTIAAFWLALYLHRKAFVDPAGEQPPANAAPTTF